MNRLHLSRSARAGLGLAAAVTSLMLAPRAARAEQFVLFDVTFPFTKMDADNSTPSKSHFYVKGDAVNPKRPLDWTSPVDYRSGTVHIRLEVLDRPESGEPTQWSLCYIPNRGQGNGYGCTGIGPYTEKGVYEKDVSMKSFWENNSIIWTEGIKQMDLVMKDKDGMHAHKRLDPEKFFPTKVRITMVQVSAGAKYDPALVPNLPRAGVAAAANGAVAPVPIPDRPIGVKKELLFSDDFEAAEHSKLWHDVVPTFAFENGTLKGTQTRDMNIPAMDGKRAVQAHAAVYGLSIPTKDSIIETKIRLDGCQWVDVEFDDRNYTGSHYGHLCRAQVYLDHVHIMDERDGSQNEALNAQKKDPDPAKQEEAKRIQREHQINIPLATKLEPGKWYTLVVETVGDAMRVTIDGKPVGYFKSAGIGHATKSKIEIGVGGKTGSFDDLKVWNAEPAK